MSLSEDQADCCPHCRKPFEIVHVKFRLSGTAMIAGCPNCAMVSVDVWPAAESQIIDKAKKLAITTWGYWQGAASWMDSLDQRFRYVLTFLIGAVITAAGLRHAVHVYGGIPPEDIRTGALMAIPIVAIVLFRRKRQLRRKRQSTALPRGDSHS
jgi:hypothetical protein